MESISDMRYDSNYLTQLLLDIAHEQSLESLLQTFIRRAMAHPQVDLACIQVWLIDRGDLCSTCPQRPNCPDQTHCLHLVVCGTNSLSGSGTNIPRFDVPNTRMPLGAGFIGRVAATGERLILNASDARPAELAELDWLEQKGIRSFSGTAISFKSKILGVIASFIREQVVPDGARPW